MASIPTVCSAFRSLRFFRGCKALLALIVVSTYLLYPSCSSERTRTVFVLRSTLPGYLASSGADVRVEKVRFGGPRDHTTAVLQSPPGRLEWPIDIPLARTVLTFGIGYRCAEDVRQGRINVRVSASYGGDSDLLYERSFWVRSRDSLYEFYNAEIPLDEYAGRRVGIVFECSKGDENVGDVDVIWGNPSILTEERTGRPNIILICIDTLRSDYIQLYNPDSVPTPNLERLADDGVVFNHAISQAPWTLPSVASVLTGFYPSLHGAGERVLIGTDLSREEIEALKRERGFVYTYRNNVYGINMLSSDITTIPEIIDSQYVTHMVNANDFISYISTVITRFATYTDFAYPGYLITSYASEWAAEHSDELFFLYAHYMEPHEWYIRYRETTDREPAVERRDLALSIYEDMVALADAYVGSLLDRLRELDLYNSSLIIVYSDHGEHFWDDEREQLWGHGNSLSNLLLEVPLIVKFPRSEFAGSRVDDYVMLVDIFDTIIEAASAPANRDPNSQSRSLRMAAEHDGGTSTRNIVSEFLLYESELIGMQRNDYRLVYDVINDRIRLLRASTDRRLRRGSSPEVNREAQRLEAALRSYIEMVERRASQPRLMELERHMFQRFRDLGYLQ